MSEILWNRRNWIQSALAALGAVSLDWDSLPAAKAAPADSDRFDALIVGSGLGGLSCAAAFARQGFRPLVLEQHDKPGGYATAFKRPGSFEFEVSLHSTTVGERNGLHNLIPGFPKSMWSLSLTPASIAPSSQGTTSASRRRTCPPISPR
jgi:hypothetical protein